MNQKRRQQRTLLTRPCSRRRINEDGERVSVRLSGMHLLESLGDHDDEVKSPRPGLDWLSGLWQRCRLVFIYTRAALARKKTSFTFMVMVESEQGRTNAL